MKNKLEQFVRASSVYERLCDKIFTNLVTNLDSNSTGSLPVLKLTLAVPMLFKTFQARLFDRIGERVEIMRIERYHVEMYFLFFSG